MHDIYICPIIHLLPVWLSLCAYSLDPIYCHSPSRPWTLPSLQLAHQLNTKHCTSIQPRAHLFPLYLKSLLLQPMHCDYRKASCCMSLMCIGSPSEVEDTNKDEFGVLSTLKAGAIMCPFGHRWGVFMFYLTNRVCGSLLTANISTLRPALHCLSKHALRTSHFLVIWDASWPFKRT